MSESFKMRAVVEINTHASELKALQKRLYEDRDRLRDDLTALDGLLWKIFEECEVKQRLMGKKAAESDSLE